MFPNERMASRNDAGGNARGFDREQNRGRAVNEKRVAILAGEPAEQASQITPDAGRPPFEFAAVDADPQGTR